jgi:hypothetical protein
MRNVCWALVVGLALPAGGFAADDPASKALVGRWGLVQDKPAPPATPAPTRPGTRPPVNPRMPPPPKPRDELPKALLEFTADGMVRVEGDTAAFGGNLKTLKPLGDVNLQVGLQNQAIKITYTSTGDKAIEVAANHLWLLDKLSAGGQGQLPPEKVRELMETYQPKETLQFAVTGADLTLTNEQGKAVKFRRFAGKSLSDEEGKRREEDLRKGLDPFKSILEQQGIKTKPDGSGKPTPPPAPKNDKP